MSYLFDGHGRLLGDHLHVGPQYNLPNPRANVIVERGPHGQYFSDPSKVRPGDGWSENLYWNGWYQPEQRIVGLMGLGAEPQGGLRPLSVFDDNVKTSLTATARGLLSEASSISSQAAAQDLLKRAGPIWNYVMSLQGWESSYFPVFLGGWDSSEDVKGNLIRTRQNAEHILYGFGSSGGLTLQDRQGGASALRAQAATLRTMPGGEEAAVALEVQAHQLEYGAAGTGTASTPSTTPTDRSGESMLRNWWDDPNKLPSAFDVQAALDKAARGLKKTAITVAVLGAAGFLLYSYGKGRSSRPLLNVPWYENPGKRRRRRKRRRAREG